MKRLFTLFFFFLLAVNVSGQKQFWGMTSKGGGFGKGCIFKTDSAATVPQVSYSFPSFVKGRAPLYAKPVEVNGKFYGITSEGGANNIGVLYEYDPVIDTTIIKFDFVDSLGANPYAYLTLHSNGKLYGTATLGGSMNFGVIFEFDVNTGIYTKLYDFDDVNGYRPSAALTEADNGYLYGTTISGGANTFGVIFEFQPGTNTLTKKVDFTYSTNGAYQFGALLKTSTGKLYGLTFVGGIYGSGVMYEFDPATGIYTKRHDFDEPSGGYPFSTMTEAPNGKLYGTTPAGGVNSRGTIFEFDTATFTYTKKYDFDYATGSACYGMLTPASNGKYYGLASDGLATAAGNIFEYDINTSTYIKLRDLNLTTEGYPDGSLTESGGLLYGVTSNGGADNGGIIFTYDIASTVFSKKADFDQSDLGAGPNGSLLRAANGKFYGMTFSGGATNLGTLFEYDPLNSSYYVIREFDGLSGAKPRGSVMQAGNGKLYGMTTTGGANDFGVIFEYDPSNGNYLVKHDFDSLAGSIPYGALVEAADGKLYGMTSEGGASGYGIIFSFDPASSAFSNKYDFDSVTGANPFGSLMLASNGKMYGMTSAGGSLNNGVIFGFNPSSGTYSLKYEFDDIAGSSPAGSLTEDTSGVLYGMTKLGGLYSYGVIFSFDTLTNTETVAYDFDYGTGRYPMGSLLLASDGRLMGMASDGGLHARGVIFKYEPLTATYTKLSDFEGANGSAPQYSDLIESCMLPYAPQAVSGPGNVCDTDAGIAYSVPAVPGASYYIWTLPVGASIASGDSTNNIDVDFTPGASSGNIVVKAYNECGTSDSSYIQVNVSICTGINENASGTGLSVFPNPSKNVFNLKMKTQPEDAVLNVYSMDGRMILKRQLDKNEVKYSLDLSGQGSGIYHLQVKTAKGTINKKLVIN